MAKIVRRDYEKDTNILAFPMVVMWMDRDPLFVNHTSRLEIHLLWWHWGWSVERGKKDGK